MTSLNDYKLVMDLYDNLAIVDINRKVKHISPSLSKIFEECQIEFKLEKEIPPNNQLSISLIKTIDQVFSAKQSSLIPLKNNNELIAIPSVDSQTVFIGLENKINRIIKIEYELKERVKELECLYDVSQETESALKMQEILSKLPPIIEKAFQSPEDTSIIIELDKHSYGEIKWASLDIKDVAETEILLSGKKRGLIKTYLKFDIGFLGEELKLLEEIASKISSLIEREEKTVHLEKQQKILSAKNEALIKMTEECYQKREKLNAFIKAISDLIIVVDKEFNIVLSNKDEIGEGEKCYYKVFGLNKVCDNCPALLTFKTGNDNSFEKIDNQKNILLQTHPVLGVGEKVERVLEVCRDITNQKQLESQLIQSYKLASLGKLVAGVAHEINNPNTFILGNLKIVQESLRDIFPILDEYYKANQSLKIARLDYNVFKENISVLIDDMINGANRTKKIVADLRNFAKKDDGALTEEVDINYIIKNNLTLTRKHIKKYAELEIDLDENIPTFKGSMNKIEQVLLNLAINGSEAIEHDHGLVKISTSYNSESDEVILIVSDNGSGMDESTLKNIFDPFFTTKRNKGGTGLGLSITYGIINELNGKIEVESHLNNGTTFTIRIPVKR